jgi:hypothetical protein
LAGGVLITPHTTVCDATLFLPGLLLARGMRWPAARAVAAFALTPLYILLPRGGLQVAVLALLVAAVWMDRIPFPGKRAAVSDLPETAQPWAEEGRRC